MLDRSWRSHDVSPGGLRLCACHGHAPARPHSAAHIPSSRTSCDPLGKLIAKTRKRENAKEGRTSIRTERTSACGNARPDDSSASISRFRSFALSRSFFSMDSSSIKSGRSEVFWAITPGEYFQGKNLYYRGNGKDMARPGHPTPIAGRRRGDSVRSIDPRDVPRCSENCRKSERYPVHRRPPKV